jgi:hypothetical protein
MRWITGFFTAGKQRLLVGSNLLRRFQSPFHAQFSHGGQWCRNAAAGLLSRNGRRNSGLRPRPRCGADNGTNRSPGSRCDQDAQIHGAGVCNRLKGFPLRSEAKLINYPDHYTDQQGTEMWNKVMSLL